MIIGMNDYLSQLAKSRYVIALAWMLCLSPKTRAAITFILTQMHECVLVTVDASTHVVVFTHT